MLEPGEAGRDGSDNDNGEDSGQVGADRIVTGVLGGLALAALLAARRDRVFLLVAALSASVLVLQVLTDVYARLAPGGLPFDVLSVAALVSLAEATGLPRPIGRRTRLGVRNPERAYDLRTWYLLGPFLAAIADPATLRPGRRRDQEIRSAYRLVDQLAATMPPTWDWARVRDAYAIGVRATAEALAHDTGGLSPMTAWQDTTRTLAEELQRLRAAYEAVGPATPRWAVIVLLVTLPLTALGPINLADYAYQTATAPPAATGWSPMPLGIDRGDSWPGNAISDGQRIYLVSRADVHGFWGEIVVQASDDGGLTWTPPSLASLDPQPNQARPTITIGPDGAPWVAYVHQGSEVATQYLLVGQSSDRGTTWPALYRASPTSIGLIGLPQLLITTDVRLVAYTDGATGAAIVQRLGPDGQPIGAGVTLGATDRELYVDAQFLDAGLALAAIGRHVVALWHATGARLGVSVSDDAGATWRSVAPITTTADWARPQLLVDGGAFVALVDQAHSGPAESHLELERSADGGASWTTGPALSNGLVAWGGTVMHANGTWSLLYSACSGWLTCTTKPRTWFRSSGDGVRWTEPQPLTATGTFFALGAGTAAGRTWAIWQQDLNTSDEDRTIEGALH